MQYPITQGGKEIGVAQIHIQGLYYYIQCRCIFHRKGFHRVMLSDGQREWDLGVCVPVKGAFCLEKRIPKKELGEGTWFFFVRQEQQSAESDFAPVYQDRPFAYLDMLESAVFWEEKGEAGLLWDHKSSSSPTGQWSEPSTSA